MPPHANNSTDATGKFNQDIDDKCKYNLKMLLSLFIVALDKNCFLVSYSMPRKGKLNEN